MKHTQLPLSEFIQRRQRFFEQMLDDSIAIFSANKEVTRSNDTEYPFCQNKNFYYLTGFNEPEAILVLIKSATPQAILFCQPKDPLAEVWHGRRIGEVKAKQDYGFDQCFTLLQLTEQISDYLNEANTLYFCRGQNESFDQQIYQWLDSNKAKSRQGFSSPKQLIDCQNMVEELRLIKSEDELTIMRQVNVISGKAHQRAMEKTTAGKFEYQIEAEILHEFARYGARFPAYNSIVAGGDNANILHYTNNDQQLNDGDLLLIDAGGELAGYAADITRTFPVNGVFSAPQKALYQLVLDAQQQCIQAIKPGQTLGHLNELCCEVLTKGLLELGILSGDYQTLLSEKACKKYFIHGLGHWLGLDVHDVGDYHMVNRAQTRAFEAGMVMTIEPGLYIPLEDNEVDEKWRGIGIRIEDNIAVTDQGHENLTVNAPKSIEAIEQLMAK
ncbi:Xaa-Pro aminopeptidase [Colwellia sp. 1_MG-2023]|uniref:Xaa-Pro aminopeptidase n=1 Tax=Colwellia sp. 1_MG-2023 TaxID=3062649 RepID=UPI0026E2AEC5|nr:Xaa-Pro aminopeptidase [Colwellia sp. 1_MG-2023]MDO6445877.1 Xaa-Pro aminopeptidase [Colwellia sp. 1_MG-2023]